MVQQIGKFSCKTCLSFCCCRIPIPCVDIVLVVLPGNGSDIAGICCCWRSLTIWETICDTRCSQSETVQQPFTTIHDEVTEANVPGIEGLRLMLFHSNNMEEKWMERRHSTWVFPSFSRPFSSAISMTSRTCSMNDSLSLSSINRLVTCSHTPGKNSPLNHSPHSSQSLMVGLIHHFRTDSSKSKHPESLVK